jgi:hypothetical protein
VSSLAVGGVVFVCVFGGALLGIFIRAVLPDHHRSTESKDIVKLGMGLIATMAALVLGLLIASAKGSYDARANEITQLSANIVLLDRVMAHFGPDTKDARDLVRRAVVDMLDQLWPGDGSRPAQVVPTGRAEGLYDLIQALSPQNDVQRSLQAQALSIGVTIAQTRWLLVAQSRRSIPMPFLVLLVAWVAILFVSFGLFAPSNATVIAALFVCALSVSSAIFLILELDQPFSGLIQISSAPMRETLAQLGR